MEQNRNHTDDRTPDTLLIIDNDESNRNNLSTIFSAFYNIEETESGKTGLERVRKDPSRYCAVLLDATISEMNGLEILHCIKQAGLLDKIPVFLITAEDDAAVLEEAYKLGIMDIITKPIVPYVVIHRVRSIVELFCGRLILSKQLSQAIIDAMSAVIEFCSGETSGHVQRIHDITQYMLEHTPLGEGFSREAIEQIALASITHDVGKIAIPSEILHKPGKLTPEEFEVIKTHTTCGAQLLGMIPQFRESIAYDYAYDIALHHHERWDGTGYPDGLKGDEISLWTQIVSLADVYDALSNRRAYKEAYPRETVLEMIRSGDCGAFNPYLLECFSSVEPELSKYMDAGKRKDV